MGYFFLILTILLEGSAVVFMKLSHGFHNKLYAALAIAGYGLSFFTLTLALKKLPLAIANATWAGASTILVAVAGIVFLEEHLNMWQTVYLLLIVIGIVGFNYVTTV